MGASLSLSTSVTNKSDTTAEVKVTLKVKSTSGSWNGGSQYGYITIDGTKYEFHHSFSANTTTTLATKSKSISRTTASKSITIKGYYKTGVSPGNISKSGSATVSARPKYTVTFNGNGVSNSTASVFSGYTAKFPSISRTGYTFKNWNTASGGTGTAYSAGANTPAITSSRTYYAQWNVINYSISYILNEGIISNQPTSYNVTTNDIILPRPSRIGYDFIGWTGSNGETPNQNVTITKGSIGDKSYTANWRLNVYNIQLYTGWGSIDNMTPAYVAVTPISNPIKEALYELVNDVYVQTNDSTVDSKTYYRKYYSLLKNHDEAVSLPTTAWPGGSQLFAGWGYNSSTVQDIYLDLCPGPVNGQNYGDIISLTAIWSAAVRPIYFHFYNSVTDEESIYRSNKIFNNKITNLIVPIIQNYIFKGWYTNKQYDGNVITSLSNIDYDQLNVVSEPAETDNPYENGWYTYNSTTDEFEEVPITVTTPEPGVTYYEMNYEVIEDIHLYAKWNESYTIIYNINNPSYNDNITAVGSISPQVVENGQTINLSYASTYSYGSGQCTASGWSINSGDNNIKTYNDNDPLQLTNKGVGYVLNLYAVWTPTTYHVYLESGDEASGNTIDIPKQYYESYTLPSAYNTDWQWTLDDPNYHLSNWLLDTINIPLATTITVIGNTTYKAAWVDSYHVPVIPAQTGIKAERYVDANYTSTNEGGKYIQISAVGTHGSYDGKTVSIHTYNVDVAFYDTTEIDEAIPIATHNFDLTSTTETFYQVWRKPLSDSGPNAQLLYDKKLNMLYCVLQIIDTTDYGESISEAKRTFTYSFEIPLKRAIAIHMADDLSAIAMFEELQDKDAGLMINNNNVVINHLWAWKIDPVTKHMYLEWIGETANE